MNYINLKTFFGCLSLVALVGCSDPNEEANSKIIKIGQSFPAVSELDNLSDRLAGLKSLRAEVGELIRNYSTTNVAVKLQSDEKIGGVSLSLLDRHILMTEIITDKNKLAVAMTLEDRKSVG